MTDPPSCPDCGTSLSGDRSPEGLCPDCLLRLGLGDAADAAPTESSSPELPTTVVRPSLVASPSETPTQIGPYRILRKLGEGGMGEVYEAEQVEPVRRKVALKLIKWGMDTREVVARFEAERQALAMMNHVNIARVYDAGATERGRPYFVMEYVEGVPITDYCDRQRLRTRERLELFRRVCDGVQHAHHKGIIHRDIKPSNVLVALEDGNPVPKIIDFGVARATEQRLTEKTVYTELGQLVGTPAYMSPEQADPTSRDIDTRTDVYSLGMLLYELLSGALPFDARKLRQVGYEEMLRWIREEDPSRPSTRVSGLGEAATAAARNRGTEAATLVRQLRGDLDWIVTKALEKDRARRYGSPAELSADVARHLCSEPVVASPPSAAYRIAKFTRRHRLGVAAAGLVTAALLLGVIGTTVGMLRARAEARRAEASNLFALGREILEKDSSAALAYAVASLELADEPEVRRLALRALWRGPTAYAHETPECAISMAFSPDGASFSAGGWAGMHQLWNSDGLVSISPRWKDDPAREEGRVTTHGTEELVFVDFSDDNRFHVSSSDKSIRVWSLPDAEELRILDLEPWWFEVRGRDLLTFTPAGTNGRFEIRRWPLAGGGPRTVGSWERPNSLEGDFGPMRVDVDPDGEWLAYAEGSNLFEVQLARIDSASPRLVGSGDSAFTRVYFHPDGERIATFEQINDERGVIRLWPRAGTTSASPRSFEAPLARFREVQAVRKRTIRFDPGGRWMAAATLFGGTILLWDLAAPAGTEPMVLGRGRVATTSVGLHPGGGWLAAAECPEVSIWPLNGKHARVLRRQKDAIYWAAFDPGGEWVASASWDGAIRVWSLSPGGPDKGRVLFDTGVPVQGLNVSPDGERIVGALWDGRLVIVPVAGGTPVELSGFTSPFAPPPAFDREGRRVAAGAGLLSHDAVARVWDLETGSVQVLDPGDGRTVNAPQFLPGEKLVTGGGSLRLWDLETGESEVLLAEPALPAAVGPHGRYVLVGLGDYKELERELHVFDLQQRVSWELTTHGDRVSQMAWHPSGRQIVSSSSDGVIRVGPITGEEPHLILGSPIVSVPAVSPDGKWIVSAGLDGTLRLWPWPEGRPVHTLPRDEFQRKLQSLTNYRVVRNGASITGYRLEIGPFPGWAEVPTW